MNKTNKIITIVTMLLLIASLIGNFYLMNNQEIVKHVQIQNAQEEYAQKYMDFDSQTKQVKKSIYEGSLAAGTSPTEVKYLLMKLAPELNDAEKDNAMAQYINHIQYFASTYTNVALMYNNIIRSLSESIDFSTRDAAFQVSDKVLRNLLLEIWDSDMMLFMPANLNSSPSVIVDYDGLMETYADYITSTTKEYLVLKSEIVNGTVSNEDGSINYENLETFMDKTYKFISSYPDFAIVEDVKYMYVVASKMFMDVYMLDTTEVEYTGEAIARLTQFSEKYADTPSGDIAKMIIKDVEENGKLTTDVYNQIQAAFAQLATT